jgi:tetratricopeptide (TPR) repeat protein
VRAVRDGGDRNTPWMPTLQSPVDLIALSINRKRARCRLLDTGDTVVLSMSSPSEAVPGEIVTIRPIKQWRYAGLPCLSGTVESVRVDAAALGLVPLRMEALGLWDPADQFWGDPGVPIGKWARAIIAWGPRDKFEMEQIVPGADPDDPFSDPITEANDRRDSGDLAGAIRMLNDLCEADLRCLDAHAHLGYLTFHDAPWLAVRHYEVGFRIGELSLRRDFGGVLPWAAIDNRPFLRCMHGFGLCLWRLGRYEEAKQIFERMLWLNPTDNQGVRFVIDDVKARVRWQDSAN